jgi:hypothetical protein
MTELRQSERRSPGRLGAPAAGAIDRQRVKTAPQSQDVGRDRHQKTKDTRAIWWWTRCG